MLDDFIGSPKRVLEPIERVSEVLFGLIMVLGFTGSLSVAEGGEGSVRLMLVAALGCNLAWGIIDAVLYLMGCLAERGRALATLIAVRQARDPQQAHELIAGALPPVVASLLNAEELESLRQRLRLLPEPTRRAHLVRDNYRGALGVFLLVFLSTLPVVIPFLLVSDPQRALRISNAVGIAALFLTGWVFGRSSGRSPWGMGFAMVILGGALVALTMALGG